MSNEIQALYMHGLLDDALKHIDKSIENNEVIENKELVQEMTDLLYQINDLCYEQAKLSDLQREQQMSAYSSLLHKREKLQKDIAETNNELESVKNKNQVCMLRSKSELDCLEEEKVKLTKLHDEAVNQMMEDIDQRKKDALLVINDRINMKKKQLLTLKKKLDEIHQKDGFMENNLKKDYEALEIELKEIKDHHKIRVDCLEQSNKEIALKLKDETEERAKLEKHFERVDENNEKLKKEEEILSQRKEIERDADKILNDASTIIQKRFRGKSSREWVDQLKKSKLKKKKGNKNRKKNKK